MPWIDYTTTAFGPANLSFNLTLKVKCQVKGHGCIRCPERLAVTWDHFGTRAGDNFSTISGHPLFDLEFNLYASYRLRPVRHTCWYNFDTISFTSYHILYFITSRNLYNPTFRNAFLIRKYRSRDSAPQLKLPSQRSDLFSVYRTYFWELFNQTITNKRAPARASFWSVNSPKASQD